MNKQTGIKVNLRCRSRPNRQAFHPSTYMAWLEDDDGKVFGTTRGHDSWVLAAATALKLADRRGYIVMNRAMVEIKISSE